MLCKTPSWIHNLVGGGTCNDEVQPIKGCGKTGSAHFPLDRQGGKAVAMSFIFPLCPGTLSPGSRTEGTISVQRDRYVKGLTSFRALHKSRHGWNMHCGCARKCWKGESGPNAKNLVCHFRTLSCILNLKGALWSPEQEGRTETAAVWKVWLGQTQRTNCTGVWGLVTWGFLNYSRDPCLETDSTDIN